MAVKSFITLAPGHGSSDRQRVEETSENVGDSHSGKLLIRIDLES
jgi:hypothetical protein